MSNVNKIVSITSYCFFIMKEHGGLHVFSEECESNFENIDFTSMLNKSVDVICLGSLLQFMPLYQIMRELIYVHNVCLNNKYTF